MRRSLDKSERAVEQFRADLNCSQAVLGEFAEESGADYGAALRIACGFGAGMGCLGRTCGAVNGGIMVIGLKAGVRDPRETAVKSHVYDLVRSFIEDFEARFGSTSCQELLGCDIGTPEGQETVRRLGLLETRCTEYVAHVVSLLEAMLEERPPHSPSPK